MNNRTDRTTKDDNVQWKTLPLWVIVITVLMLLAGLGGIRAFAAEFEDVQPDDYYAQAVTWAVGQGITSGVSDTHFSPDGAVTRAQAVTFLWRAAGKPAAYGDVRFTDVPAGAYYSAALRWAVANGIVTGISDVAFGPDVHCTRAQIVTFLWRMEGCPDRFNEDVRIALKDEEGTGDAYYYDAFRWSGSYGLIRGLDDDGDVFDAEAVCNRAQIVTMLYRNAMNKELQSAYDPAGF